MMANSSSDGSAALVQIYRASAMQALVHQQCDLVFNSLYHRKPVQVVPHGWRNVIEVTQLTN
jgi:hypothetical protein